MLTWLFVVSVVCYEDTCCCCVAVVVTAAVLFTGRVL